MAFVDHLTPETRTIVHAYLAAPWTMGETLLMYPQSVRSRVLAELSQYVDIRGSGPDVELYFKK